MKKLFVSALCLLAVSGTVIAQKVDLDKFNFEIEYLELPVHYLTPEQRTYSISTNLSPMAHSVISDEDAANRLAITNFSRREADGAVQVNLRIGNTTFNRSEVRTRKVETKDKAGKVTAVNYYYSVDAWYSNDGGYTIIGPKNPYNKQKNGRERKRDKGQTTAGTAGENPFLQGVETTTGGNGSQQTINRNMGATANYSSPETRSSDDALRAFRINGGAIMQSVHNDFVNAVMREASGQVNRQYGYVPVKEAYHLWILDSKSHPEYEMQQNAIAAVKELLGRVKAESSTAALETALKPVMAYFESLKTKYTSDEKSDKKLRYSAYFNLAKLYLVLDYPDKAIEQAQGLIKNGYDTGDGEDLIERAEELQREMEFHHISTRHVDRS